MRTFLNNHPYLGLAIFGMLCATAINITNTICESKQKKINIASFVMNDDDELDEECEELKEDKKD